MNLGDLPNPKAADEAIKAFRKKFKTKVCLAPDKSNCARDIISSHTLSAEAMLRPISRNGHVYAPVAELMRPDSHSPVKFKLQGIRDTSVFNGFCSTHDKALFAPIEDSPFTATPQQLFLHAFRAGAKESYIKRKQAEGPMSVEQVKAIHGIPTEIAMEFSNMMKVMFAASLRGAEEIERVKARLDTYHLASDWGRISTTVIPFATLPPLSTNFVYAPDYDFKGRYLQNFEDMKKDLDHLFVTVTAGAGGGYALFSHIDTAGSAPRQMIASLLEQADVTSALIWLIFGRAENVAIAPAWFEALPAGKRASLEKQFISNVDPDNLSINTLRDYPLRFDDWKPGSPFVV